MAKIEISKKEGTRNDQVISPRNIILKIDGVEIKYVRHFELYITHNEAVNGKLEFFVDDIDVDANILADLTAIYNKNQSRERRDNQ